MKEKNITSYESVFMRISGMRLTQEYEILHKDSGSEISDYWMRCASSGGMERDLQRRAFCPDSQMLELLNQCDIMKWDGFHGKFPSVQSSVSLWNFGDRIRSRSKATDGNGRISGSLSGYDAGVYSHR